MAIRSALEPARESVSLQGDGDLPKSSVQRGIVVNPELWQVRNSDDDLVPVPNPSKIKMTFTFSSLLDDANRLSSPYIVRKLFVK